MRRTFAALGCCAVVALAGCGQSAHEKADLGKARSIVTRFAAAGDASACNLLTTHALKNLYGNFTAKRAKAKAKCIRTATGFKGAPIRIIRSELLDNRTAKVVANSADNKFSYSVNLRRKGGKRPWRIDTIAQAKLD
jgi:hypothetical protein